MTTPAPSDTPTTSVTYAPFPGGFSPGDTGDWNDGAMGAWFAVVIISAVSGPFMFLVFVRWFRKVFRHV